MAYQKSKLLYNDKPAVVGRDCARKIGIAEALVLQTLHFAILDIEEQAEQERNHDHFYREYFHEGFWWLKGTYDQFASSCCNFTNAKTLRNIVGRLEAQGFVISVPIPSNGGRKNGKLYRINHAAVDAMAHQKETPETRPDPAQFGQPLDPVDPAQNGQRTLPKLGSLHESDPAQTGQPTLPKLGSLHESDPAQTGQPTLPKLGSLLSLYNQESVLENQENNNKEEKTQAEPDEKTVVVVLLSDTEKPYALAPDVAQHLVETQGVAVCRQQLEWLADRPLPPKGSRAGQLRCSIEQKWGEPEATKARRKEATRQVRLAKQAGVRTEPRASKTETDEGDPLDAQLRAFEFGLDQIQCEAVDAKAMMRLAPIHRDHIRERQAIGQKLRPDTAAVWDSTRKAVLMEMMQNTEGSQHHGESDNL